MSVHRAALLMYDRQLTIATGKGSKLPVAARPSASESHWHCHSLAGSLAGHGVVSQSDRMMSVLSLGVA